MWYEVQEGCSNDELSTRGQLGKPRLSSELPVEMNSTGSSPDQTAPASQTENAVPRGMTAEDNEARKRYVAAKFGSQGWEEGAAMAKPHRCRVYLHDIELNYNKTGELWGPLKTLISCVFAKEGCVRAPRPLAASVSNVLWHRSRQEPPRYRSTLSGDVNSQGQ